MLVWFMQEAASIYIVVSLNLRMVGFLYKTIVSFLFPACRDLDVYIWYLPLSSQCYPSYMIIHALLYLTRNYSTFVLKVAGTGRSKKQNQFYHVLQNQCDFYEHLHIYFVKFKLSEEPCTNGKIIFSRLVYCWLILLHR